MTTHRITALQAVEILDSRGRPTICCRLAVDGRPAIQASVPSGASTGAAEAHERRDGGSRHAGLGCRQAVAAINGEIADHCQDQLLDQESLDRSLCDLDGTANKARLGGNAILAVSVAFARAAADAEGLELWQWFAQLAGVEPMLPQLTINLFSGGKHAGAQVPVQDLLLVPRGADSIAHGLEMVTATFRSAAEAAHQRYGMRLLTADEGGLAPPFPDCDALFGDAVAAIEAAGLRPADDMALAMDVASSHFFQDGVYNLESVHAPQQMVERVAGWARAWPLVSIEDGLAEDDWAHWPALRAALAGRALCLGDDLLCTNPQRIQRAIDCGAADALLLKVNQIGTLSEALEALRLARAAGWQVTISARSGETEDDWLADLAVGWAGDQIKVGSITQSERLAKYNRLLMIEAMHDLPLRSWRQTAGAPA